LKVEEIRRILKEQIEILQERYKVKKIGIFGSYIHGDNKTDSDIDILVEFSVPPDIFEFIRLEEFLSNLLGRKVDLVSIKALKPMIKENILQEAIYI